MGADIIKVRGEFWLSPDGEKNPATHIPLTVVETHTPKPDTEQVKAALPIADRVEPYLQRSSAAERTARALGNLAKKFSPGLMLRRPDYLRRNWPLAEDMLRKGWSFTYSGTRYTLPDSILAFSYVRPLKMGRQDKSPIYVLQQFGVTQHKDIRDLNDSVQNLYESACGATMCCNVEFLAEEDLVYVEGHPGDRRNGYFFEEFCGFEPTKDLDKWGGAEHAYLLAPAGIVRKNLLEKFDFLKGRLKQGDIHEG
jgi:hypothetical protein